MIESIDSFEIDEADFQRVQKKNIGILIGVFNSPESIANMFSRYYFEGIMIFDLIDCLASLSLDDINQLKSLFDKKYLGTCMIKPKENGQ